MEKEVTTQVDSISFPGTLTLTDNTIGLAVCPRQRQQPFQLLDRFVAGILQKAQIGTLLFGLLAVKEDQI